MKKKGIQWKRKGKVLAALIACMVLCLGMTSNAWAYFNRGTVGISTGQKTVSVAAGSSTTVSVSLSPASDRQTEGCGMAECPQSCGEKECLDENGQCTCNGTEYKTYTTSVAVSSSNTSVATASYSNGTLSIRGVSEGTAVLTLTASLRQFSSGSTTITVNVSKGSSTGGGSTGGSGSSNNGGSSNGGSSSGSGNSGGSSSVGGSGSSGGSTASGGSSSGSSQSQNGTSGNGVTASNVTGGTVDTQTGQANGDAAGETSNEVSVVNSDRGTITFVPLTAGKMGADYLTAIQGKEEYVDFQKKDDAGNILYAWEFLGTDIKNVFDMDFGITTGTEPFEGCDLFEDQQAFYIAFSHEGELPGKASVFLQVPADMENGSQWYLYYYDEESGQAELQADGITVENGFVTLELEHCSDYVLCENEIASQPADTGSFLSSDDGSDSGTEAKTGIKAPVVVAVVLIVILAAVIIFIAVIVKKQKNNGAGDASGGSSDDGAGES